MPIIKFIDGNNYNFVKPIRIIDIIKFINPEKLNSYIAGLINNELFDITDVIDEDCEMKLISLDDINSIKIIRKSCVQLLGYAIKKLWPEAKIAETKIIENGFYCDIDINYQLKKIDIKKIENNMNFLIKKNFDIFKKKVEWKEAFNIFNKMNDIYTINLLFDLKKNDFINLYYQENYLYVCKGPNVPNISFCKNFKIQKISGAYWKNINSNKMLQRIYGTAWSNEHQLKKYIFFLKEAKKRDHRKISKKLDLYHIEEETPGMIYWHNNGYTIFRELENFIREKLNQYQYQEVKSPFIANRNLWEKTGHWKYYQDSMFITNDEDKEYCIKPMNCPGHVQIFKQKLISYRLLPIRMAEFGNCHRKESSGSLHGLIRAKNFTQDDAHIFCTEDQIKNEIFYCIKMLFDVYNTFGFKKILVKLSTRPKKRIGNDKIWDIAEYDLINSLKLSKINFEIQKGEGAFYGPKIEFVLYDSLNRPWQCGTIQLDFFLPNALNATYIDKNNNRKTPVMIHRAILGSIERFIGILIEEYSGFLPVWLSPIQIVVLNINKKHILYAQEITKKLEKLGFRVKSDLRNEKINFKIREHSLLHIPYMIICGTKEIESKKISLRTINSKKNFFISFKDMINQIQEEIKNKKNYRLEE